MFETQKIQNCLLRKPAVDNIETFLGKTAHELMGSST